MQKSGQQLFNGFRKDNNNKKNMNVQDKNTPKKMRAKQWKIFTTHPTLVLLQKFSRFLRLHWQCFSSFADQKKCDSMEIQCFQVALAYQNPERMLKCTPTNTFRLRNSEINVF